MHGAIDITCRVDTTVISMRMKLGGLAVPLLLGCLWEAGGGLGESAGAHKDHNKIQTCALPHMQSRERAHIHMS